MSFLFLIIIQCYISGKPLILIINTFLKSTVIHCEYVLVPSFYLGTYLNNVLYWVVLWGKHCEIDDNVAECFTTLAQYCGSYQHVTMTDVCETSTACGILTWVSLKSQQLHRTHSVLRGYYLTYIWWANVLIIVVVSRRDSEVKKCKPSKLTSVVQSVHEDRSTVTT